VATFYRGQEAALNSALGDARGAHQVKAADCLRSPVSKIVLTPEDGTLVIDLQWGPSRDPSDRAQSVLRASLI
jgi:hypothetical protein